MNFINKLTNIMLIGSWKNWLDLNIRKILDSYAKQLSE